MGARVQVHYVGWLLDGRQFDSSRDRGTPFEFVLGAETVIKGWELAIESMTQGEVALIRCRSDYAYGRYGVRPLILPNATLDFEIELVGWEDYDAGVEQDVQDINPFDDDEDEEVTIDLDDIDSEDRMARAPASEEAQGPARGSAVTANGQSYSWEESDNVITLFVPLPADFGARDVSCTVAPRTITLEVPAAGISLVGPLRGRVYSSDAYWLIDVDGDGNRCIQVYMDKVDEFPTWNGIMQEAGTDAAAGLGEDDLEG
ncbi:hypothetical protein T492DRAFT_979697 [Pavlovales sp. CCMP2436]|nr:hypothetical protein T492DRAFT_979697 [Pavlovales sp. CCMP2436]